MFQHVSSCNYTTSLWEQWIYVFYKRGWLNESSLNVNVLWDFVHSLWLENTIKASQEEAPFKATQPVTTGWNDSSSSCLVNLTVRGFSFTGWIKSVSLWFGTERRMLQYWPDSLNLKTCVRFSALYVQLFSSMQVKPKKLTKARQRGNRNARNES